MPETSHGIVYPESIDHTRLWEHYQNLAESVEPLIAVIPIVASGYDTLVGNGTDTRSLAVTFPDGLFPAPPAVTAVPATGLSSGNITQTIWVNNVTATGFTLGGYRSNSTNINVRWTAIYTPAAS